MSIKYICNLCDKDVTEDNEYYIFKVERHRKDQYSFGSYPYSHICHDCYMKILGFTKTIKIRTTEVEL